MCSASAGTTAKYLIFQAGTQLALPIEAVSEVIPYVELICPPTTASFVAGITMIGNEAVTVLDLAQLLGTTPHSPGLDTHLIRLKVTPPMALLVERAHELLDARRFELAPVSQETTFNNCVSAELLLDNSHYAHVLDVEMLLTSEERARISDHTERARSRLAEMDAI